MEASKLGLEPEPEPEALDGANEPKSKSESKSESAASESAGRVRDARYEVDRTARGELYIRVRTCVQACACAWYVIASVSGKPECGALAIGPSADPCSPTDRLLRMASGATGVRQVMRSVALGGRILIETDGFRVEFAYWPIARLRDGIDPGWVNAPAQTDEAGAYRRRRWHGVRRCH